jgi:hypothetical protein
VKARSAIWQNVRLASTHREILTLLNRYDEPVRELAMHVRGILHAELAPCREFVCDMRRRVVFLYSGSDRVIADGICQMPLFTRHVTLMFPQGVEMKDPAGILQGSGRVMRHVRIESADDIARADVIALLRQARALAGLPRRTAREAAIVTTTIKRARGTDVRRGARQSVWPDRFF